MKKTVYITGLDIGTTKIACVVGELTENNKIKVIGYGKAESYGVKRGMVFNIQQTVDSIRKAVDEASEMAGVEIKKVNVGIAGHHIKSFQHRGSLTRKDAKAYITQEELDELRDNAFKIGMQPGEEIIDAIPQEYIVDNEPVQISDTKGMIGNTIEANFHVIIGQRSAVENIVSCVEDAGLVLDKLILEPIASAMAVLGDDEKEAGVVLVDMGGGTTDIAIFHDSIIYHTAVIPFGGNVITDDIRMGCSVLRKYAEEMKVRYGSALPNENNEHHVISIPGIHGRAPKEISFKNLSEIIHARLAEIFDVVKKEIENSPNEHALAGGLVLTGGGALMNHIQQLAAFKTSLDVRIGYPNEHIDSDNPDELKSPVFSTCIGLILESFNRQHEYLKPEEGGEGGEGDGPVGEGGDTINVNTPVESEEGDTKDEPKRKNRINKIFREIITRCGDIVFKNEHIDEDIDENDTNQNI